MRQRIANWFVMMYNNSTEKVVRQMPLSVWAEQKADELIESLPYLAEIKTTEASVKPPPATTREGVYDHLPPSPPPGWLKIAPHKTDIRRGDVVNEIAGDKLYVVKSVTYEINMIEAVPMDDSAETTWLDPEYVRHTHVDNGEEMKP